MIGNIAGLPNLFLPENFTCSRFRRRGGKNRPSRAHTIRRSFLSPPCLLCLWSGREFIIRDYCPSRRASLCSTFVFAWRGDSNTLLGRRVGSRWRFVSVLRLRSEERRVGEECRSRWSA